MRESRKIVRIFLASPGDLGDERRAAKEIVEEFNRTWADTFGYQLELIGWEDTVTRYGRPQSLINQDLEHCELFVGLMWKRWGTPPALDGPYTSGFQEEFSLSVARHLTSGRPEISLFLKDIPPELANDPGDELKKVLAFREKIIADKAIYFERFADVREFETSFRRRVSKYAQFLMDQEILEVDVRRARAGTATSKPTPDNDSWFSIEGRGFLQSLLERPDSGDGKTPLTPLEIARLRLLSCLVDSQQNDEWALGVHDANVLYAEKDSVSFGPAEISGLVEAGLQHFKSENAPFWHWRARQQASKTKLKLTTYSFLVRSASQKVGALTAMRLSADRLTTAERSYFGRYWFRSSENSRVRIAALEYLADLGGTEDIPPIRDELAKNDVQTANLAATAVFKILLREDPKAALAAVAELQTEVAEPNLVEEIFRAADASQVPKLIECVSHRSILVRRAAAQRLSALHALDDDVANRMLQDTDAEVRLTAILALLTAGKSLAEDDVRKALVKPNQRGIFGLAPDLQGQACWDRFRLRRLEGLSNEELEREASSETILDQTATFVLYERKFDEYLPFLRASVTNAFADEFDRAVSQMEKWHEGRSTETVDRLKSLETQVRRDLTQKGLEIICRRGGRNELDLVRRAIKTDLVNYSDEISRYFRANGTWEDIVPLSVLAHKMRTPRASALLAIEPPHLEVTADAIYHIGRGRLPELLLQPLPRALIARVILIASEDAFIKLSDDFTEKLLRSDDDSLRKVVALKCVQTYSRKRVKRLLDAYIANKNDGLFYNVVHWLDMGVSVPQKSAIAIARLALARHLDTS